MRSGRQEPNHDPRSKSVNLRHTAAASLVAAAALVPAVAITPAAGAQIDPASCASTATELVKVRTIDNGNRDRVTVAERRSKEAQDELHAAEAAYKANPSADNADRLHRARAEADRRRAYVAEVNVDLTRSHGELVRISVLTDRLCDVNGGDRGGDNDETPPTTPPTVVPVIPVVPVVPANPPAESAPGSSSSSDASTSQVGQVPGGQGVKTGGGALAPFVA